MSCRSISTELVANGLTLPQVLQAVSNSNINVGGNTVNIGAQSAVVRGVGLIRSIDDLNNTMVSQIGRQSGAGQGYRHRHRRREAAARHRRPRPGRRHRAGHRVDAARRAEFADHHPRRAARRYHQQLHDPAAGGAHRAHLRPQGPDRRHHPHRAAQHGGRDPPDRAAAMDIPRRPAQRADRRRDDPVRAVLCRDHPGAARRIRQPALGRRDRFRTDRRCHRDHGGGDLPQAVADHGACRKPSAAISRSKPRWG